MPLFLLSILDKCNLNCKHCRSEKQNRILTTDQANEIAKKLKGITGFINLTGGEPLLHPNVEDIIKIFKQINLKVSLSTNGTFLTKDKAQKLRNAGLDAINISLDSLIADQHNAIRNSKTSYDESLKAIETATNAGLNTRIAAVYCKENIRQVLPIIKFALKKKCAGVSFRKIMPVGAADKHFLVSREEDFEFLKKCYLYLSLLYSHFNIFVEHPLDSYIYYKLFGIKPNIGCGAFNNIYEIKTSGQVYPCPALQISIGNIFKDSINEIDKERKKIFNSGLKDDCGKCKINNLCGGCRALAFFISKDPNGEDSFCIFDKIEDLLADTPRLEEKNILSAKDISPIINLTEKNMRKHLENSGIDWDKNKLELDLTKKSNFWIIKVKGKLVGYVWFEISDQLRLKSIIIDSKSRRKGMGSILLERLNLIAKGKPIMAFVQKTNKISQKFFESEGYIKIGEEKPGFVYSNGKNKNY